METDFRHYGIHTDNVVYHSNRKTPTSTVIINAQNGSRTILHGDRCAETELRRGFGVGKEIFFV